MLPCWAIMPPYRNQLIIQYINAVTIWPAAIQYLKKTTK